MANIKLFSYSQFSMYKECPQRYYWRYVKKIPEKPKSYFAFGHSIHGALEYLYKVDTPPFPTLEQVQETFRRDWQSTTPEEKGYTSELKAKEDFADGLNLLAAYYAKHAATMQVPLSVECRATHEIDGLPVIIVVDRIDYLGEGKVGIVDYKTGKTLVKEPDQLHMYQLVLESKQDFLRGLFARRGKDTPEKISVDQLTFYQLKGLNENHFGPAEPEEIKEFWSRVLKAANDIRSDKFTPTPGERQCRFCDFKNLCPVFAGKQQATLPPAKQEKPKDLLSQKIERFGQLTADSGKIAEELKSLRREIIVLLREQNATKAFGGKYQVQLKKVAQYEFTDKKKMVELLKKSGAINKTLAPVQSKIEKLLAADADIAKDLSACYRKNDSADIDCEEISD